MKLLIKNTTVKVEVVIIIKKRVIIVLREFIYLLLLDIFIVELEFEL
jgi:hypothetical protein